MRKSLLISYTFPIIGVANVKTVIAPFVLHTAHYDLCTQRTEGNFGGDCEQNKEVDRLTGGSL